MSGQDFLRRRISVASLRAVHQLLVAVHRLQVTVDVQRLLRQLATVVAVQLAVVAELSPPVMLTVELLQPVVAVVVARRL